MVYKVRKVRGKDQFKVFEAESKKIVDVYDCKIKANEELKKLNSSNQEEKKVVSSPAPVSKQK